MRKYFSFLIFPLVAIIFLCGCGDDKTFENLKNLYDSFRQVYVVEDKNIFFSDELLSNSLVISYPEEINNAINNVSPSTDIQKCYVAIGYQQKILDYIFNYYEKNQNNFYKIISSKDYDKNEMNNLYGSLESLKNQLNTFKSSYSMFCDATTDGVSNIMEFNLFSYSYDLNQVIEKSFDFIYKFINMNTKYCISDYEKINATTLQYRIDKTYVDIAYIIYLQNFKAFNYSVGSKGICDLSSVVENSNEFVLVDDLQTIKSLSSFISTNIIDNSSSNYQLAIDLVNNYLYSQEVFDQRINNFKLIYNEQNIYTITQYKFGNINGVDYDSFLSALTPTEKSNVMALSEFESNYYNKLLETFSLVIE